MSILNVAAYRFVPLPDAAALVAPLRARCTAGGLKGTVIVAAEGINLFLAGANDAIDGFLGWLATDAAFVDGNGRPLFAALPVRRSRSATQPFARLKVKVRPEIVTMRRPTVRPTEGRAPALAPERLAAWLAQGHDDDGRLVVLLDTRNAFEVEHGAFDGARHLQLAKFDDFPAAVDAVADTLRDQTVVTYCTGGIRCEKAALHLQASGFAHVWQLDGGILAYLATVGGRHWRGDCFVFDDRVAVDAMLAPIRD